MSAVGVRVLRRLLAAAVCAAALSPLHALLDEPGHGDHHEICSDGAGHMHGPCPADAHESCSLCRLSTPAQAPGGGIPRIARAEARPVVPHVPDEIGRAALRARANASRAPPPA